MQEWNIRLCLVTVFVFYFQKKIFWNINQKKILVFLKSKTCLVSWNLKIKKIKKIEEKNKKILKYVVTH